VLLRYRLRGGAQPFENAIMRLAARVERAGHPGVLGYRFFANPEKNEACAVVDYADPAAWIGHHEIAMAWPEMAALHGAAELYEITFLGPVPAEITDWLSRSPISARVETGFRIASGFLRPPQG
jgi:hypothetical protein